jgi:ABC-type nitrate/sulfonate/bicarbonate transport system substrate-binding protein
MASRPFSRRRRDLLKLGGAAAAASLLGAPAARSQQRSKLTVVFPTRSAASWPMFCAREGGFYDKYGLDVDLKFGVHPTGLAGLVSGDVHMTNPSLDQVAAAALRDPSVLVAMASMLNKGTFALMARPDIPDVPSLKGKRFGIGRVGDPPYWYTVSLFKEYGLKPTDVNWVPTGADANARAAMLLAGGIDAALLTAPSWFALEGKGLKVLTQLEDHDVIACTVYTFKRSFVAENPDIPERIIRAQVEALKRFYDDKAFAIETYLKYDPIGRADAERVYEAFARKNLLDRVPLVPTAAGEAAIERLVGDVPAARNFDMQKAIDMSVVRRLIADGFFEKLFGDSIRAEQDSKLKATYL